MPWESCWEPLDTSWRLCQRSRKGRHALGPAKQASAVGCIARPASWRWRRVRRPRGGRPEVNRAERAQTLCVRPHRAAVRLQQLERRNLELAAGAEAKDTRIAALEFLRAREGEQYDECQDCQRQRESPSAKRTRLGEGAAAVGSDDSHASWSRCSMNQAVRWVTPRSRCGFRLETPFRLVAHR